MRQALWNMLSGLRILCGHSDGEGDGQCDSNKKKAKEKSRLEACAPCHMFSLWSQRCHITCENRKPTIQV